jgi:hypothetical protein
MSDQRWSPSDTAHFIVPLDGNLKAIARLIPVDTSNESHKAQDWYLELDLVYDGESAGKTSFRLSGFSREEAEAQARNIRRNGYIMKEVDEFLWGESD